jgi:hypothetical protein
MITYNFISYCKWGCIKVKNNRLIPFLLFLILISISFFSFSYAKEYRFDKNFHDVGYKEVHEALKESEEHFEHDIVFPIQLPPIVFTHNLGRLTNLEGNQNDYFEITYLNQNIGQNHYNIEIRPIDVKVKINEDKIERTLKLSNSNEAIFSTTMMQGFNILAFEKGGFQYLLSIDKRVSDEVTPEILVEIANSVNY